MTTKSEKVQVRIQAEERIRYLQVVEMTREEFEELDAGLRERGLTQEIQGWIDPADIYDSDDFEVIEFELEKPTPSADAGEEGA